ncbi:MAG: PD-(D/E)XK nuclease family protein [Rhodocyclaceae bacterium]|nr:PD-(D/E)XK nuclease family protein [Rhodocyclaceae bacterium]
MDVVRVRASSWAELFDCPMRWRARHLDGVRSPSGVRAQIGTAIHAGAAAFDQATLDGYPISIADASDVLVNTLDYPQEEVVWTADDPSKTQARAIALRLLSRYCELIAPTKRYIAVERRCDNLTIDVGNGIGIELTGTTDRIRETHQGPAISDLKSGLRRATVNGDVVSVRTDGPQLGVYELLAEQTTGLPITGPAEIIGMQTRANGGIGFQTVPRTREILIGTQESPGLLQMAGTMFKEGLFPPNPSSTLCSEKYCPVFGHCRYHN